LVPQTHLLFHALLVPSLNQHLSKHGLPGVASFKNRQILTISSEAHGILGSVPYAVAPNFV
jgi:hypothetical protein